MQENNLTSSLLPEYEKPPLIEAICGVTFQSLDFLTASHFGVLWGNYQPGFPIVQEAPPLDPLVEIFEKPTSIQMQLTETMPLPREMFFSEDRNSVIQVQRDKFLYNWRKNRAEDVYPRFTQVMTSFKEKFSVFEQLIKSANENIHPVQYELTYINRIEQNEMWEKMSDIGAVFPNFSLKFDNSLILNESEAINLRTSFAMPNKMGRLHTTVRSGTRPEDNKRILLFDLTARGIGKDNSASNMEDWFSVAREWIVKGFTDLTSTEIQNNIWKRRI